METSPTTTKRTAAKRAPKRTAVTPPAQPKGRTIEEIADELELKGRELLKAAAIARGEKVDRRRKGYR